MYTFKSILLEMMKPKTLLEAIGYIITTGATIGLLIYGLFLISIVGGFING